MIGLPWRPVGLGVLGRFTDAFYYKILKTTHTYARLTTCGEVERSRAARLKPAKRLDF
jgi:hypothetical protein